MPRLRPGEHRFEVRRGPVFTPVLLADEINRAPAKVQSALLEAMEEQQVTVGDETFALPDPFLVMATQNPIELEGTYPLPEAQIDRFLLKVVVPTRAPRRSARSWLVTAPRHRPLRPSQTQRSCASCAKPTASVHVADAVSDYAVRLVRATRDPDLHGARLSPSGAPPRGGLRSGGRLAARVDLPGARRPGASPARRARLRNPPTT